jgi:TPR repeat protein
LAKPNGDRIPTAPDGGYEELARARDLLSGSAGPSNAGQASVWLWKAVGKNNIPAVLMLADLYARGDGVPRSCDQARILLTAALKRGSVEANQKLRELQNSGCSSR